MQVYGISSVNVYNNSQNVTFGTNTKKVFVKALHLDKESLEKTVKLPGGIDTLVRDFSVAPSIMKQKYIKEWGVLVDYNPANNKLIIKENNKKIIISSQKHINNDIKLEYTEENLKTQGESVSWIWFLNPTQKSVSSHKVVGETNYVINANGIENPKNNLFESFVSGVINLYNRFFAK